jgi:hypothetical protein
MHAHLYPPSYSPTHPGTNPPWHVPTLAPTHPGTNPPWHVPTLALTHLPLCGSNTVHLCTLYSRSPLCLQDVHTQHKVVVAIVADAHPLVHNICTTQHQVVVAIVAAFATHILKKKSAASTHAGYDDGHKSSGFDNPVYDIDDDNNTKIASCPNAQLAITSASAHNDNDYIDVVGSNSTGP